MKFSKYTEEEDGLDNNLLSLNRRRSYIRKRVSSQVELEEEIKK